MEITQIDITNEAINVLRDGANRLCDYAVEQWMSDKYKMGHEACQENIRRWRMIREKCHELIKDMKEKSKEAKYDN